MCLKTYVFIFLSLVLNFSINGYICSINSFKSNKADKYVHILSDVHISYNCSDEYIKNFASINPDVKITDSLIDQFRNCICVDNNFNQIKEFKEIVKFFKKNNDVFFLIEGLFSFANWKLRLLLYCAEKFNYFTGYKDFIYDAVNICKSNHLDYCEIDFRICLGERYIFGLSIASNQIAIYNKIIKELLENKDKLFHKFYDKFIFQHKNELQEIAKNERHKFTKKFLSDLFNLNILNYLIKNNDKKHLFIIVGLSHSTIIKDFLIQYDYTNIFNENDIRYSFDYSDNSEMVDNIKITDNTTFFQFLNLIKPIKLDKFKEFVHKLVKNPAAKLI